MGGGGERGRSVRFPAATQSIGKQFLWADNMGVGAL